MGWLRIKMSIFVHVINFAVILLSNSLLAYARCQPHLVNHIVEFEGCSVRVQSAQCIGNCEGSYAHPSETDLMTIHRNCECCMPSDFVDVAIRCRNRSKQIRKITKCRCRPCSSIAGVPERVEVARGRRASKPTGKRNRRLRKSRRI
ncbi:submaxillary apomucin [Apostichopus japonicus]|uniref:Submaxillary apomucin n=1 Tax=Stichopus japonicus TaxID=307972 RepID=A0A2G8K9X6_STIJA|nr:submaxillary apomucin [Apostichopus japonicus]